MKGEPEASANNSSSQYGDEHGWNSCRADHHPTDFYMPHFTVFEPLPDELSVVPPPLILPPVLTVPVPSASAAGPTTPQPDSAAEVEKAKDRQSAQRAARIVHLLHEFFSSEDAISLMDAEGYAPITKLMRASNDLHREAFGSPRLIIHSIETQASGALRLDKAHRRVRLQTNEELIRAEAERLVRAAPLGAVPLSKVITATLQAIRKPLENPEAVVREALKHGDSAVIVRDTWVVRRPHVSHLQKAAEALLSDEHLSQDSRLRSKIADSPTGEVPLQWLCSRYVEKLGIMPQSGARAAELSAVELCQALKDSEALIVDQRRLTVARRMAVNVDSPTSRSAVATVQVVVERKEGAWAEKKEGGGSRAAVKLRHLLDFYFEPFTFQHNRYLIDLVARKVGQPAVSGPWGIEDLRNFSFSFDDLKGLGRITASLLKLSISPRDMEDGGFLGSLKYLRYGTDRLWHLRSPPEVRGFVTAPGSSPQKTSASIRFLAAAREQRGQAPDAMVSVLSYALAEPLQDQTSQGKERHNRLKRQLVMHHTDVVCLQGLDADRSGSGIAATLAEESYGFACASGEDEEANSIFWDRTRWECVHSERSGAALAVDLRPLDIGSSPHDKALRVICGRPKLPNSTALGLQHLLDTQNKGSDPVIVCADLAMTNGPDGDALAEELACMRSVMQEVTGEELSMPCVIVNRTVPMHSAANGLNRLSCPDAMLFRNVSPLVALSGHTEGYMACMKPEDLEQQFPAYRLPIVAAFDWHSNCTTGPPTTAPHKPIQRIRI
eukprot:gnl/TRDRNA2_/TRDRNA2_166067_c0_seq1.p1 gnl/TRDRNA2_/TRDRNA2_166067_c0~~gnl/TRDRNA2_/TRDRNA2_166067_c0_seq1.p1  ORF type:complete len:792 (-),score=140.00 gnl/TRDRNA2_/TRDRNA2_166067_c0_seq1:85-2424(-)